MVVKVAARLAHLKIVGRSLNEVRGIIAKNKMYLNQETIVSGCIDDTRNTKERH